MLLNKNEGKKHDDFRLRESILNQDTKNRIAKRDLKIKLTIKSANKKHH